MNHPSRSVLLLAASHLSAASLQAALEPLAESGRPVRIGTRTEPGTRLNDLPNGLAGLVRDVYGPAVVAERQGPAFRRALHAATDDTERLWIQANADERVRARVVAGDELRGLDAGGATVAERLTAAPPTPPEWRLMLRCLRAGGLARVRAERSAARALAAVDRGQRTDGLLDRDERERAGRLIDRAAALARSPRRRADLLGDVTARELAHGRQPSRLIATAAAELAVADAHLAAGRAARAAESVSEALGVLFHRAVQFDRLDTPLAADPIGFTAPLRDSSAAQALVAPRGRDRGPASDHEGPDRQGPLRVLLATHGNSNMIGGVRDRLLALDPPIEVREINLAGDQRIRRLLAERPELIDELISPTGWLTELLEAKLRSELDRADVVFVDWCAAFAVLVTGIDPRNTRVIVRLHSYEAFSPWPHMMDFSRVDDLVFVSEHLRDLAVEAIPALAASAVRQHVLPIGVPAEMFAVPKDEDARFTLGLVGYGQIAKDPLWAFAVLRRLRTRDDRYRLLLIGPELDLRASAAARDYLTRFHSELAALESEGAVRRDGPTQDVPAALRSVGVILSSSVRESYHLGLIEGAASGAVPVVRDWPLFANRARGARSLYPDDWVVADVEQAATRILATTGSEQDWRRHGDAARSVVDQRFDTAVTDPLIDRLFLGSPATD